MQTHIAAQALHAFADKHNGQLPAPWNQKDAQELIDIAKHINETQMKNKVDKIDEKLLRQLSYTSQGAIVSLTSFAGGVVAQECIKALSGKYSPLQQWMYFDGVEVLPALETDASNFQPSGTRADGQIICLGKDLCNKLSNSKLFMVHYDFNLSLLIRLVVELLDAKCLRILPCLMLVLDQTEASLSQIMTLSKRATSIDNFCSVPRICNNQNQSPLQTQCV